MCIRDGEVGEWAHMFALRSEYSMLQSFVDEEFARFMGSNPCDSELSMELSKAKWAYDNFYTCAREFFFQQAMDGGDWVRAVSYTTLRAHETPEHPVCRLFL